MNKIILFFGMIILTAVTAHAGDNDITLIIEDGAFLHLKSFYNITVMINDETADDIMVKDFLNFCLSQLKTWEEKNITLEGFPVDYFEENKNKRIRYDLQAKQVRFSGNEWIKYTREEYFADSEFPPEVRVTKFYSPLVFSNEDREDEAAIVSIDINGDGLRVIYDNDDYDEYLFSKIPLHISNENLIKKWRGSWVKKKDFRLSYELITLLQDNNCYLVPKSEGGDDFFMVWKTDNGINDDRSDEIDLINTDRKFVGSINVSADKYWKRKLKYTIIGPVVEVDEQGFLMLNGKHIVDSKNKYFKADEENIDIINKTLTKGKNNYLLILGNKIFYLVEEEEIVVSNEEFHLKKL